MPAVPADPSVVHPMPDQLRVVLLRSTSPRTIMSSGTDDLEAAAPTHL